MLLNFKNMSCTWSTDTIADG